VAQLAAHAVGPAEDLAVDHHPAAHPGAEREHHEVVHLLHARLGQRGAAGVVVDHHWGTEAVLQLLAHGDALERDVDAGDDDACLEVDLRGEADADSRRLPVTLDQAVHGGGDLVDQGLGAREVGGLLGLVGDLGALDHPGGDLGAADVHAEKGGRASGARPTNARPALLARGAVRHSRPPAPPRP
jgi:hypothetical protein